MHCPYCHSDYDGDRPCFCHPASTEDRSSAIMRHLLAHGYEANEKLNAGKD